jgi:hypothetical protein
MGTPPSDPRSQGWNEVMASNSAHQRALYRSREAAKANGTLPAWYAAREAEREAEARAAAPPKAETAKAPFAPLGAVKSPERTAWDSVYSGPEVGPVGGSWPDDGRHVPRMVWRLPFNSAR